MHVIYFSKHLVPKCKSWADLLEPDLFSGEAAFGDGVVYNI